MRWKILVNISMKIFCEICPTQQESECFHLPGVLVLILSLINWPLEFVINRSAKPYTVMIIIDGNLIIIIFCKFIQDG